MISIKEYIEKYVFIKDKNSNIVNFKFNTVQEEFYQQFRAKYNAGKPFQAIVLKARQMGISTVTEALLFSLSCLHYNKNSLVVAHDNDATNNIFNMTKRMYDNLPDQLKPMIKYSNSRELSFANPTKDPVEKMSNPGLNSSVRVATAGSGSIGRSMTLNYIHLSEFGFWGDNAKELLLGLAQAVPKDGKNIIVIESTANGYNYFKELWDGAVAGTNGYIPFFFPWFEMKEYSMPYDGFKLTDDEEDLKEKYNLSLDQLTWRRWCIKNRCDNDVDKFRQEYPSFPEEAFLLTGRPVFNTELVFKRIESCPDPIATGFFVEGKFVEDTNGAVKIWKYPEAGHVYVLGGDTAGEGSDRFTAYLIDNATGEQVASYCYEVDEPLYVSNMFDLGCYYNWALLAIEANFSSYPNLKLQEMEYPNLYVRKKFDTYKKQTVKSFGYVTSSKTRPIMIANLVSIVNDSVELINDKDLLREMLSFIRNDAGRAEAAQGMHDDMVMSCAICYMAREQAEVITVPAYEDFDERDEYNSFLGFGG